MRGRKWSREELLIAFNYYCCTAFGRLHSKNPEIVELAQVLDRSPGAVAMKLCNFASFDPAHRKRDVKGLGHVSLQDKRIWDEFNQNWEQLAFESEQAVERITGKPREASAYVSDYVLPSGPTEKERVVRTRIVQHFFRQAVLTSYQYTCAVCGLTVPEMLCASHIVPWAASIERRADPTNGLALCSFHHRAFDRGLITVDSKLRIVVTSRLIIYSPCDMYKAGFASVNGESLILPLRFLPDLSALEYHRTHIYKGGI